MKTISSILIGLSSLLGLLLAAAGCAASRPYVIEERQYIQLHHVANTAQDVDTKGKPIAMVCTRCKTVLYPKSRGSRFGTLLEHRHYCPGCKSTITVTGAGFKLKEEIKHTCEACGSESVFCCATGNDAQPTEGMDQSK